MYEKVNPKHPDKIADRIAGALVDLAYDKKENPHVAVEVLIGHGKCHIINETDTPLDEQDVLAAVKRITESDTIAVDYVEVAQDPILNENQSVGIRCGDNGIFRGVPPTHEQKLLTAIAASIYKAHGTDGKYLIKQNGNCEGEPYSLTICQSHMTETDREWLLEHMERGFNINGNIIINPLGEWTGGPNTDSGATNRKLGSDMGDGVTGGGLHGKDLSKTDVSVNIYLHLLANKEGRVCETSCAIGDDKIVIDKMEYQFSQVVNEAKRYIDEIGGFEKLAEWGLIRP